MRAVSRASNVVGFAGCDSVELSEVVNRLLVADGRGSITPGYAWLAKRACAHPGLLPDAGFAARRDEETDLFLFDAWEMGSNPQLLNWAGLPGRYLFNQITAIGDSASNDGPWASWVKARMATEAP